MKRRGPLVALVIVACTALALAAEKPPAVFYRGLNLNGPPLVLDGNQWDGKDAKNYVCKDNELDNQKIPLNPPTDRNRARMIRTSRWGNNVNVTLTDVKNGTYQVFLYVWEDNNAVKFSVALNGKVVVPRYESKSAGHWEKLGPWLVTVTDGKITLTGAGGDANFSGVEVWSGDGPVPPPRKPEQLAAREPTPEGLELFEKKIRPLLTKHCYACHSAEATKLKGELCLDSRAGVLKGGASGPAVVPASPEESLLIAAVRYDDPDLAMPPKGQLSKEEIADLEKWVKMGVPDPRTQGTVAKAIDFAEARKFWSFQPVRDVTPPEVKDAAWPRTALDRFVLAKLEAKGMRPAPAADKRTLLRRATFDLTGLPPTPEEVAAFLTDDSPDAFARVIDRLLASPHYGERWGRHWLDLVRYADTSGCNSDFPVPTAYLYRNYVLASLNADKPYDQFVREQVAGDLLPHKSEEERYEHVIATGYLATGRRYGSLADEFHLTIEDNIDNLGKAVLGLSVSCARCHDHKFDPVPQADYYALYGIFQSTRYAFPGTEIPPEPKDFVPLVPPDVWQNVIAPYERQLTELTKEVERLEKEKEKIRKGEAKPKDGEKLPTLEEATAAWEAAKKRRDDLLATRPQYLKAYAVAEGKPGDARVHRKGDPRQAGETVPRGFLQVLGGQKLSAGAAGSGRLQLAGWLTDRDNPLTARVLANRLWQYHFGQGLVRTPNDFGARGSPPTHPELLDYLAARLVENGWSLKAMHKLIMLSQAYQTACVENMPYQEKDPKNELLWTFARRRLSAEEFRDALLAVSGRLDRSPGGPHPFPPEPFRFTQHKPFLAVYETDRRSVYLMQQRIKKHPWLEVFDGADPNAVTAQRPLNTTPIQALFAMNDPLVHKLADAFADRLRREADGEAERIRRAFLLTFGRPPTEAERELMEDYLRDCRAALPEKLPAEQRDRAAWASLARVLFCGNEFIFVD